jgi:hypothetical protein
MGFLDTLKQAAAKIASESDLAKQAVDIAAEALRKIEGTSVEVMTNKELYRVKVSAPTYARLPNLLRSWVSVDQWHELLFTAKDTVFLVEESHLKLHPAFKQGVNAFVYQLLHAKKPPAEGAAVVPAEAARAPVPPAEEP